MKNYDSKINPYLGVGILGAATPVAVYLIGFLATLLWGLVTILLFPLYYSGILDENAFTNITGIVSLVLQVIAVVVLTLVMSVFADLKIYHLLISSAASGVLFLITERFFFKIKFVNFPWQMLIFPRLFAKYNYSSLKTSQLTELGMYLTTAMFLTGTFFAISLVTWGICRAALRKNQVKERI